MHSCQLCTETEQQTGQLPTIAFASPRTTPCAERRRHRASRRCSIACRRRRAGSSCVRSVRFVNRSALDLWMPCAETMWRAFRCRNVFAVDGRVRGGRP